MGFYLRLTVLALCIAAIAAVQLPAEILEGAPRHESASAQQRQEYEPEPDEPKPVQPKIEEACEQVGQRKPVVENCKQYSECSKDKVWKTHSCYWFQKFDSQTLKCMYWGAKCATASKSV